VEEFIGLAYGFGGFVFKDLEEEGEFGDFDGLVVDIDAEDVIEEDSFFLCDGEEPLAARALIDFVGMFCGAVGEIPVAVVIEEVCVCTEEE
jgi:hypothetical protein